MKKLLCWMLAFLLCFGLFAGCDSYDRDDDDDDDDDDGFSLFGEEDDDDGFSFGEKDEKKEPVNATEGIQEPTQTSTAPTQEEHPTQTTKTPAQLYTEYLTNGGYQKLVSEYGPEWSSEWTVTSCLIDLNEDSKEELLIQLAEESMLGARGYPTVSAFLAIRNNQVEVLDKAYYTGGTLGGEFLYLVQDEQLGRLAIGRYGYWRDGAAAYNNETELYTYTGTGLRAFFTAQEAYLFVPTYQDQAKEVQSKTDHYILKGDELFYWCVDSQFVSEQDYHAANSCYVILHDWMAKTSQANPLP